jgi:hypothetical protein
MAVYEVKDSKPLPAVENVKPRRREARQVMPVGKVRPVDFLKWREKGREEGRELGWHERETSEPVEVERSAETLIRLINQHLERLHIQIHLALFKDKEGYSLDVHDCRDGRVCEKVAEEPINLDELPDFLARLRKQAGILLDKKM